MYYKPLALIHVLTIGMITDRQSLFATVQSPHPSEEAGYVGDVEVIGETGALEDVFSLLE